MIIRLFGLKKILFLSLTGLNLKKMKSKRILKTPSPNLVGGDGILPVAEYGDVWKSMVLRTLLRDLEPTLYASKDSNKLELIIAYLFHDRLFKFEKYLKNLISNDLYIALNGLRIFIKQKNIQSFKQLDIEMNLKKQQFLSTIEPCECMDELAFQRKHSPPGEK
jgi:hypothetical protein